MFLGTRGSMFPESVCGWWRRGQIKGVAILVSGWMVALDQVSVT